MSNGNPPRVTARELIGQQFSLRNWPSKLIWTVLALMGQMGVIATLVGTTMGWSEMGAVFTPQVVFTIIPLMAPSVLGVWRDSGVNGG